MTEEEAKMFVEKRLRNFKALVPSEYVMSVIGEIEEPVVGAYSVPVTPTFVVEALVVTDEIEKRLVEVELVDDALVAKRLVVVALVAYS